MYQLLGLVLVSMKRDRVLVVSPLRKGQFVQLIGTSPTPPKLKIAETTTSRCSRRDLDGVAVVRPQSL